ncbi:MAG: RDD family protein [Pirellulales bacterium]
MSNEFNPYGSPAGHQPMPGFTSAAPNYRLADLGKRFLGALVDGLAGMVFVIPGYGMMIAGAAAAEQGGEPGALMFIGMGILVLGSLALMGLQIYLLATRSQTVGKYIMKTQIVDYQTGLPADFVKSFLMRALVNGLICGIPCVGSIYAIVDICYIFSAEHRCLHDLLAGTVVVDIS